QAQLGAVFAPGPLARLPLLYLKSPEAFRAPWPPEADPDPHRPIAAGPGGEPQSWRPIAAGEHVNLKRLVGGEYLSAYVLYDVYSPAEQDAVVLAGSDDQLRLWLNGRLVHEYASPRVAVRDQDRVLVRLRKGWNRL